MSAPRVSRGPGPKAKLTEGNYRKKALPLLLVDFKRSCAYCLDPDDFRHPSLNHVEHFNCKIHGRGRHQYKNLMLACAACNLTKHDKPVVNPLDKRQRLLNCTVENEFPEHIWEDEDGQWVAATAAGEYHLTAIGLQETCHKLKRRERRKLAQSILGMLTTAILYESHNPEAAHQMVMNTVRDVLDHLDLFPPLVTKDGVLTVREWLATQGVDTKLLVSNATANSAK